MLASLDRATGKFDLDFALHEDPTNKLRAVVVTRLKEPLEEGSDRFVRRIIHAWAALNDVEVRSVEIHPGGIEAVFSLKYRGGETCDRTPWDDRLPIKAKHGLGSLTSGRSTASRRRRSR